MEKEQPDPVTAAVPVGVWPRCLAQVFDAVVTGAVAAAIQLAFSGADPGIGPWSLPIWLVVALLYFFLSEGLWGATVGKWLLGLTVVREDGADIGLGAAAVRTAARLVDGLCFYAVGAVLIWSSGRRQRLGDRLAGTLVVAVREGVRLRSDGTHVLASQVPLVGTGPQPPHTTAWLPNPSADVDEPPPPSALPTWDYDPPR
ncbi:MAG: RDD family protein [Deltaproteobacteria bacterium]